MISKIKSEQILIFFSIIFLCFSFPLQVYSNSPIISLMPYVLLIPTLFLSNFFRSKISLNKNLKYILCFYVFIFFFNTSWQLLFEIINLNTFFSLTVVFILPIIFFFKGLGLSEDVFKPIVLAIIISGILVGAYYVYDAYSLLILKRINQFAIKSQEYITNIQGISKDTNMSRMRVGYRSQGLLEKHTISAAWVCFACFASLYLTPFNSILKRTVIIVTTLIVLLIGLNFTSIIGFFLTILFFEFNFKFFSKKINLRNFNIFSYIFLLFTVAVSLYVSFFGYDLIEASISFLKFNFNMATGVEKLTESGVENSFFSEFLSQLLNFPKNMLEFPLGIIIGSGFNSNFGIQFGGDYGLNETLNMLGIPLFFTIISGIIFLLKKNHKLMIQNVYNPYSKLLRLSSSVIFYVLFCEIHYSIWTAKSIFPIFIMFIAISFKTALKYKTPNINV